LAATKRVVAVLATFALASTLAACGGVPREAGADDQGQSPGDQAGDSKITLGEINADNVAGICEQALGSIADLYEKLALDVPADATFGYTDDRYKDGGGWADEYFPEDGSMPATLRCQAPAKYEDDSGSDVQAKVDISIAAGDSEPRGNTDFTAAADGLTAGMQSNSRSGSGMQENYEEELVEQSTGEQFLTDDVLTKFQP
jgi:hypothetical protein